jgi:hypothetical protein
MLKLTNTIIYVPFSILSWGIWKLSLIMTLVVLVFPVWFAGSSGQSYGSIDQSARSRYVPFFVSKTYCFALLFFKHEK